MAEFKYHQYTDIVMMFTNHNIWHRDSQNFCEKLIEERFHPLLNKLGTRAICSCHAITTAKDLDIKENGVAQTKN